MTRWKKSLLALVLAVSMTAALTVPAMAAEAPPTEGDAAPAQAGGVTLVPPESFAEDLAGAAVDVDVYKVADLDLETGLFTLTENFQALEDENWTGVLGPDEAYVTELWDAASKLVSARTMDPEATPAPEGDPETTPEPTEDPAAIAPDYTETGVALDGSGRIEFMLNEKLGAGLYLVVPRGTETHDWVYSFGSGLLSVPSTIRETNSWNYELTVDLKAERERRLTGIEIEKTLLQYNANLGPTTFVFDVVWTLGDETGSQVVSLTFGDVGTQTVTVEGIPVGAQVTVTERDTGNSYFAVDGKVEVSIESLPLPEGEGYYRVEFTNDYDWKLVPDKSVENVYVFNGTGWEWQSGEEAEG